MRTRFVCGNWKMNVTDAEASGLVDSVLRAMPSPEEAPEIALAPPFTSLKTVGEKLRGTALRLAAQNLHGSSHGALTGEISAAMLAALGVAYVIVGHSERRRLFGESDQEIGRKAAAASAAGIVPILCVGEEVEERMDGRTIEVVERQLFAGIERLDRIAGSSLVVAYEPVWAIGTGRTATAEQATEVHAAIRGLLARRAGDGAAREIRILYGGSVTPESAPRILASTEIDGALVGGASLVSASFAAIVCAAPRAPRGTP